jgi:hypothetical protein
LDARSWNPRQAVARRSLMVKKKLAAPVVKKLAQMNLW